MNRQDFHFNLPPELIAQQPLPQRSESRLLVLNRAGAITDSRFNRLPEWLRAGDRLVFNNTKVIPARLLGQKRSGGRVELLLERLESETTALAHLRSNHPPKVGGEVILQRGERVVVSGRSGALFHLTFEEPIRPLLNRCGELPLPPYIHHSPTEADQSRYQTIYARYEGAVAAPTAGLHFDAPLLARLKSMGVESSEVTLHVGAGTFQPVRVEQIHDHTMHSERIELSAETVAAIQATRAQGGRIVAVGTTVARTLESVAQQGELRPFQGETAIFITPGFRFQVVDRLITNFHLPESTLLMLVSAFAGYEPIRAAYAHAIANRYRFFSYGDAMLLERSHPPHPLETAGVN